MVGGSEAGDLVALFNGYRIAKSTNKRAVRYGDEEWSDFRKADVKLEKNAANRKNRRCRNAEAADIDRFD
jgi:hypothetical protein